MKIIYRDYQPEVPPTREKTKLLALIGAQNEDIIN
jgi:hypothetical protein